jgi:iron complex transport system substrate-binding protein
MKSVLILLVLFVLPAMATAALPLDSNQDGHVSMNEFTPAALEYLMEVHGDLQENFTLQRDVQDAAFVLSFWNGTAREVKDSYGHSYLLSRPLHHIVVMNSETLETLRSIGVSSEVVVGVDKYTLQKPDFFPEYEDRPGVGSIWSPDYEKILTLRPDAVFLYATVSPDTADSVESTLRSASPDLVILRFDGYLPATYHGEVEMLREIFGKWEKGDHFLEFYHETVEGITDRAQQIPEEERVRVYFESWTDYKTGGKESGYQEKIVLAGGKNIFGEEPAEYPMVDPEAVIIRDPQVVVKLVGAGDYTFGGYLQANTTRYAETYQYLLQRPGWSSLEAVKDHRVYLLHNDIIGGPQFVVGTAYLARWFYPEIFASLDPETVHLRYIHEFQGLPEDRVQGRVFTYS